MRSESTVQDHEPGPVLASRSRRRPAGAWLRMRGSIRRRLSKTRSLAGNVLPSRWASSMESFRGDLVQWSLSAGSKSEPALNVLESPGAGPTSGSMLSVLALKKRVVVQCAA